MGEPNIHYVCTRQEARVILARQDRFWVSNCGCREPRGGCARSRMDLCLGFSPGDTSAPATAREITRAEVDEILREAEEKHLVMRPFRDESRTQTAGFCVCCDDCCGYFLHPEENRCDKGLYVQSTDHAACSGCGDCVAVCYFGARRLEGGELAVDSDACYGCGLCLDVCPAGCITMMERQH